MSIDRWPLIVTLAFAIAGAAAAQAPAEPKVGVLDAPCTALEPMPAGVMAYLAKAAAARTQHQPAPTPPADQLEAYNDWQQRQLVNDFAGHCRYATANAGLPAASDHRVVFFGDSITELWRSSVPELFQNDIVGRGVSGQTTPQMLDRFRADVIDLHPQLVHILAGVNDIAGNTGPTRLDWIEGNIESMVELAQAHHIRVVIAAALPASQFSWRAGLAPAEIIRAYDDWLADLARRKGLVYVDYYTPLDDGHGGMKPGLSSDGVHPTPAGYAIMTPLAREAIEKALKQPAP